MSQIFVSPLKLIPEVAVRNHISEMITLMGAEHHFHRPGVIKADRHLHLAMNDINFAGSGKLVGPSEDHIVQIINFARSWDQSAPLLVHCWLGISRSPATALVSALAIKPNLSDISLCQALRVASPYASPNRRIIEIADRVLQREGRLIQAVKDIGYGSTIDASPPYSLQLAQIACK